MKKCFLFFLLLVTLDSSAQYSADSIFSPVVLKNERIKFAKTIVEKNIHDAFKTKLSIKTESSYENALWAAVQFMHRSPLVKKGLKQIIKNYAAISYDTRRIGLEAIYALYPTLFEKPLLKLMQSEKHPKLFAMQAVYLFRIKANYINPILKLLQKNFQEEKNNPLLLALQQHLLHRKIKLPSISTLIQNQQTHGFKIVYSFQRTNRDWQGLAIVQNANGSFVRNKDGKIKMFRQLARSGSALPYFITNGNTPQGIFSIQGVAVSNNTFIGPTPNLQLTMPNEVSATIFFHKATDSAQYETMYKQLLPADWKNYLPMMQSFTAGKIGRTEIIAHGTTIDPEFFKGKPFYPISPTLGCLCAKEIWNDKTGHPQQSDMLGLVNAFLSTPGDKGYLIVIELDDKPMHVSEKEILELVHQFDMKRNY